MTSLLTHHFIGGIIVLESTLLVVTHKGEFNMKRKEYLQNLFQAYNEGKISIDAYDAGLMNIDDFCEPEEDELIEELLDKAEAHNDLITEHKANLQERYGAKIPANKWLQVMQEFHRATFQHYHDALQLVKDLRANGINAKLNSQDNTIIIYR